MDTTETTHISLCSGYGGIDLGLKRVLPALRTIALCEIEAFACANLVAKMEAGLMDAAPIWTDLKTFPWAEFRDRVDILSGGYPCQPFSAAGKRAGADDPRHLWPFISSGIQILRPRLCFFENVEGHISLGLREVIADLESLGYETAWGIFSAAECGAPHQRKRVFILAVSSGFRGEAGLSRSLTRDKGITGVADDCGAKDIWPSRPSQPQHEWEPPRVVGNAESRARFGQAQGTAGHAAQPDEGLGNASDTGQPQRGSGALGQPGTQQEPQRPDCGSNNSEREIESALGGDTNGPASGLDYAELCVTCDNRTDELRLLGNGVVPATAALAFRTLLQELIQ